MSSPGEHFAHIGSERGESRKDERADLETARELGTANETNVE